MTAPTTATGWITTVVLPALALAASIVVALITARGNQKVTKLDRELPPYEALAARTSKLETLIRELEKEHRTERAEFNERAKCLEDAVDELRDDLEEDRDWIKDTIVVAEHRGATEHIPPIPAWLDLESESMRQRRLRIHGTPEPPTPDGGQPDDIGLP